MSRVVGLHHVQVNVPAEREGEARRFYGELLGLEEMARPQSLTDAGRHGAWFRCGEDEYHVFFNPQPEVDSSRSSQHPAVLIDGLDALRERLETAGVAIEDAIPIAGRRRFFVRDPGGNRIELLAFTAE